MLHLTRRALLACRRLRLTIAARDVLLTVVPAPASREGVVSVCRQVEPGSCTAAAMSEAQDAISES